MATAKKTDTKVVPFPGDPEVTAELARTLGLSESELSRAVKELARNLTHAELGVLGLLWSERESQKSARVHARRLPTSGAHVVRGSNHLGAAALDLGDGVCAVFSLGGAEPAADLGTLSSTAAMCLGGALREVIAAGAEPIALFDALRLGTPGEVQTGEQLKELAKTLNAIAKGASVPIAGGELGFDARYEASQLVQGLGLGIARSEALLDCKATGLGNTLLYAGVLGSEGADDIQRRLGEAGLAAIKLGSVEGASGVSVSGLAGAVVRLASRGDTGVELDLDALPRGPQASSPFQTLCAPAEALLLVIRKGREDAVLEVFQRHEVPARIIGRVTNTGRLVCKATPDEGSAKNAEAKQVVVADLPVALLVQDAPSYERPSKPEQLDATTPTVSLKRNEDAESELVRLLGSVNVGSREWLTRRLEGSSNKTGAATGKSSVGDAAVVRFAGFDEEPRKEKWLAISIDGNARYSQLDPRQGAAMAVAECARNIVCVGAEPLGLCHGLSLGHAERPETSWRLSEMIDGVRDACLALKLPVVQGAVALREGAAPATPSVAVIGQLREAGDRLGIGFGRQADMVALLGAPGTGNLAGSEFLVSRTGELRGKPLTLDLAAEVKIQRAVLELARERLLSSAHDVSDGGLGVALSECCIAGRIGCSIELPAPGVEPIPMLFHEEPSRVVVSFAPEQRAKVQERCEALGVPFALLGFVGGDTLEIEDVLDVPVQVLAESHSRALARIVGD
jgi:phosphoribosylformylglycinamidine (FGAM) synthase-like enzyme